MIPWEGRDSGQARRAVPLEVLGRELKNSGSAGPRYRADSAKGVYCGQE